MPPEFDEAMGRLEAGESPKASNSLCRSWRREWVAQADYVGDEF